MYKETFTERDIPYEILEKHGLTHEMIDDLPQSVMDKLLHGEFTPLLPITMKTEMGEWQYPSRISLQSTGNGVKVVLKPKIETSSIGLYSLEQQELLKQGKTIIGQRPNDLRNNENTGKYFIQYDDDINQVLSVPTSFVGENIRVLADMLGLDYDNIKCLQQGEPQTVEWTDEELNNEVQMLTFGIDLRRDFGIRIAEGDIHEWLGQAKDFKEVYNFGLYGVWIASEDGKSGHYVPEAEYTDEIREQLELAKKRNMEISGYKSEEELIELLDAGKITVLTFVTHQSKELSEEFENYCSDRELEQDEESAEQFVNMRQQMFNEAFENGNV